MNHTRAKETRKPYTQVSLGNEFADVVRAQADIADRSMAAQLEHWAKIARAVEAVIPAGALAELKSGADAKDVLSRVSTYLLSQNPVLLRAALAAAKTASFGVDEKDPTVVTRYNPDGTMTRGGWDAEGNFVPSPHEDSHVQRQPSTAHHQPDHGRESGGTSTSSRGARRPVTA